MSTDPLSFFAELQRRNVHRAAVFYAAAAWLLEQIATQVFPFFHIPEWVVRWIVIAAAIGFPFAMAFSWFCEWTPQGIRLESDIDRSESVARETGKTLDRWIIAVLAVDVVLLLTDRFVLHRNGTDTDDKSIAVLPFVNTTADAALQSFTAQYAQIGGSQIAIVHAVRNDPAAMFAWLDRALESRDAGALFLPFNDPFLIAYKEDPRFVAFTTKAGPRATPKASP